MPQPNKKLVIALIIVSVLGFADATYLTAEHFIGGKVPCPLTGQCEQVLTSKYASLGPIPLSLLGMLFYLSLFVTALIYLDFKNPKFTKILLLLGSIGFIMSLYFVYLQLFVLHAICQYCMFSAITSTLSFILSATLFFRVKRQVLPL